MLDQASDTSKPAQDPNAIRAHLSALFSPTPAGAWIEIAWGNPATGNNLNASKSFETVEAAAAFAIRKNQQGLNVYLGAALRKGRADGDVGMVDIP